MKYLDPKEFREKGYQQEINRLFLHPLGLALENRVNPDGSETISGVQDNRDDPEGMIFSELTESDVARGKKLAFQRDLLGIARQAAVGYVVQPLEVTE